MNAFLKRMVRIMIVHLMRRVSTYEDPINALVEKVGLTYRKIQRIPEEYARKLHWDALAATTKVIASPILSVKKCANASLGTVANVVKLILKVKVASSMKRFCTIKI